MPFLIKRLLLLEYAFSFVLFIFSDFICARNCFQLSKACMSNRKRSFPWEKRDIYTFCYKSGREFVLNCEMGFSCVSKFRNSFFFIFRFGDVFLPKWEFFRFASFWNYCYSFASRWMDWWVLPFNFCEIVSDVVYELFLFWIATV